MPQRIFISSVMRDFAAERAAAKEAVLGLRQTPVMAEDFGAQPRSSQMACLDGVRNCDVYVGIFGSRYGYVAPSSGLAATEEEFQEARRQGIPILCFEQIGPKEPPQALFLQRIKDYENGYAIVSFSTAEELKMLVVRAIHDQIGQPGISTLEPAVAGKAMDRFQWGSPRHRPDGTWLGAVFLPVRQGESFIDVLEFSQRQRQESLLQAAMFGNAPLFDLALGVKKAEEADALVFTQEAKQRPDARLEIHADGTLVFGSSIRRRETSDSSAFGSNFFLDLIIDEDEVDRQFTACAAYADTFYRSLKRGDLVSSLFFGSSLTGIANKTFGKSPLSTQTSYTMSSNALPDPLHVPDPPLRVSRAELGNSAALGRKMTEHIIRLFRNANAYRIAGQTPPRRLPW
jgi:Domain of unknown function (DUF4062)